MSDRAIRKIEVVQLDDGAVGQANSNPVVFIVENPPTCHLLLITEGTVVQSKLIFFGTFASDSHVSWMHIGVS